MNMQLPDILMALFASSAVMAYAGLLVVAALLMLFAIDKQSSLRRVFRKHRDKVLKIRRKGAARRETLAVAKQRKNLKELGVIVKGQLKRSREAIRFGTYHQSTMFIRETIEKLEFNRLFALHSLLLTTSEEKVSAKLDAFLQQEIEYGHLGKHRKVHFQNILYGQVGIGGMAENQPPRVGQACERPSHGEAGTQAIHGKNGYPLQGGMQQNPS